MSAARERAARTGQTGVTLTLEMRDGTKVVVPRSLAVISTYVLLEQVEATFQIMEIRVA